MDPETSLIFISPRFKDDGYGLWTENFELARFSQDLLFSPLAQDLSFLKTHDMGYAIQNLLFVIRHIKKVGLGVTDPLQDVQDSFSIRDVQSVTRFVHDQKRGRLHHGPGQENHPPLSV